MKPDLTPDWFKEFPSAVTVCDREGTVIAMNDKACATFADEGGAKLIGHSLQDCHKPETWARIQYMLETGSGNTYTIEKNGNRKLIHQQPWFKNGKVAGLVEISIILPEEMPHHVR